MSVEVLTAIMIIAAWCLVAYRVEGMKVQRSSRRVIVQHVAMGAALAVALFAPGAWGKFALALGVLMFYLLSVQERPSHPQPAARVVVMASSPVAKALEQEHGEGLARARQRQG